MSEVIRGERYIS